MSIPAWMKAGAKVVCVDDSWLGDRPLTRGEIYTIKAVGFDEADIGPYAGPTAVVLALHEAENRTGACGFDARRFRPVKTIDDDISEHFAVYLKTPVRTSIRAGERA